MAEYIDRQTVLDIITEYEKTQIKHKGTPIPGFASIAIEIEDLPAADVRENVRGEWVEMHSRRYCTYFECPICRRLWGGRYNFCPECGTDMKTREG